MTRLSLWLGAVGGLVFLVCAVWLGRLEQGGPAHADIFLDGGIPATLYLPGPVTGREAFLEVPDRDARPPGVVLMHGFASDRLGMSTLARRLAGAGYAVLAFDAMGHGQNRNPFERSFAKPDAFHSDYTVAVDFLRASALVDGERIAVMGHSMGAGASLDFATRDQGLDATVLISGGWTLHGPHRPPNALFVYASGDPGRIKDRSGQLARGLAGVDAVALGRTYGEPALRDAVRVVEIPGADHATIVLTEAAAAEIIAWLDVAFAREGGAPGAPSDPRPSVALAVALSLLLVLPGLGVVVGRIAPARDAPPAEGGFAGLGVLAAALLVTMPLLALETPAAALSIEVGDVVVSHFALTGLVILVGLTLRGGFALRPLFRDPAAVFAAGLIGFAAAYVLMLPIGTVAHRLALTPERCVVFALSALGLLPFSIAFQSLLRRGSASRAALLGVLGRILVLGMLVLGVSFGLLSFVVILMLPALVLVFAAFELLSASIYAASRNLAVIALIDAAWLALVVAAIMPVRL